MYVTADQVRAILAPGGADDQSTAAQMEDSEIDEAITAAQAEVDAHLVDRYSVPFADSEVPQLVIEITRDIAAYLATLTHSRNSAVPENHPVWMRYSRASTLLERLGRSIIDLDTTDGDSSAETGEPVVINQRDHSLFDEGELLGPVPVWLP